MNTKYVSAERFLIKLMGGSPTFGHLIQCHRECDEISQADLARKMNISRAHLCQIEKGQKLVTAQRAARFARILGYSEVLFIEMAFQDQLRKAGLNFRVNLEAA